MQTKEEIINTVYWLTRQQLLDWLINTEDRHTVYDVVELVLSEANNTLSIDETKHLIAKCYLVFSNGKILFGTPDEQVVDELLEDYFYEF